MFIFNFSEKENTWEPTIALGSIQKVREEIINFNQQLSQVKDRVYTFIQTGISHSECKYVILFHILLHYFYVPMHKFYI